MGRRKNNPELVKELIDGLWTMDAEEFEEKYNSLSSSDMDTVSDAISGMEDEWMSRMSEDDEDYDEEALSVDDAAMIWASNGKDEDYTFGYTEEELEEAFNS